jgi:hypothetical protein
MSFDTTFTAGDFEYLLHGSAGLSLTASELDGLIPPEARGCAKVTATDWMFYTPGGVTDEDGILSWQIPGIKVSFKKDVPPGEGREYALSVLARLEALTAQRLELVLIDKQRLAAM